MWTVSSLHDGCCVLVLGSIHCGFVCLKSIIVNHEGLDLCVVSVFRCRAIAVEQQACFDNKCSKRCHCARHVGRSTSVVRQRSTALVCYSLCQRPFLEGLSIFCRAGLTKGEEELLRDLRKAMETTLATETDMNVTADRLPSCQLDVDTCPTSWFRRGVRCVAEDQNEGVSLARRCSCVFRARSSRCWVRFAQARVPMSCCSSLSPNRRGWHWHATAVCHCFASRLREVSATQTFLDVRGVFDLYCVCMFGILSREFW